LIRVLCVYSMNLCEIMRDLVMPRCCFGYVSFEPMRDYAGFGYASLIRLCILWTCARLCGIWLCLVVVSVMFRLSLLFRLCSYSWLCYWIIWRILYYL